MKKMKKNCLLIFALFYCSNLVAQPFQIGHTSITLIDVSRNNRNIPTEIYYPSDIAGNNVPITNSTNEKFPVLSFGHGFVMTWDAYQNFWDVVVPEGFIIAFPKTEGSLAPSHEEFGKDLAFVITELAALSQNSSSLFFNRIDTMNCVMGHSMGGGSSFLAAQFSSTIKSIVTFAPAETNPSAIQAASQISIPALIFAGGNDCVTPPVSNQIPMYDSLQSNCKTYINIIGGSHCQMANSNFLCNFGEATCTPQPTISRSDQHATINRFLLPWLKYELKDDCLAGSTFDALITTDVSIDFLKTCLLCNTTFIDESNNNFKIDVFPNPFKDKIFIQCNKSGIGTIKLDLFYNNGTLALSRTFSNIKLDELITIKLNEKIHHGFLLANLSIDGHQVIRKIIRQ